PRCAGCVHACLRDNRSHQASRTEGNAMLVIGIAGTELTAQERDWLQDSACGGVILFSRNFASRAQVIELSQAIREACDSSITCAREAKLRENRMTPPHALSCSQSRSCAVSSVPAMPMTSMAFPSVRDAW